MNDFDCIIMNPPYDGSTHLKILNNVVEEFKEAEVVNLSPIRWLQDPLAEKKKSKTDFQKYEDIRNHIESLEKMDATNMQGQFGGIVLGMDLGIYKLSNEGKGVDIRNKLVMKLYDKGAYYDDFETNQKNGWRIRIAVIGGGKSGGSGVRNVEKYYIPKLVIFKDGMKDGKPWYDFYMKNQYSKFTAEIPYSIKFDSEQAAQNFIDTMHTKVGRYYFGNLMQDVHILPQYFLKLDYSKKWTDKELYEYFNLTSEEIKEIEETMSGL